MMARVIVLCLTGKLAILQIKSSWKMIRNGHTVRESQKVILSFHLEFMEQNTKVTSIKLDLDSNA